MTVAGGMPQTPHLVHLDASCGVVSSPVEPRPQIPLLNPGKVPQIKHLRPAVGEL
jgi:hypothetical protein